MRAHKRRPYILLSLRLFTPHLNLPKNLISRRLYGRSGVAASLVPCIGLLCHEKVPFGGYVYVPFGGWIRPSIWLLCPCYRTGVVADSLRGAY